MACEICQRLEDELATANAEYVELKIPESTGARLPKRRQRAVKQALRHVVEIKGELIKHRQQSHGDSIPGDVRARLRQLPFRRKSRGIATLREVDVTKILAELRSERDELDEAIIALERMGLSGHRRRGRPPAWLTAAKQAPTKRRGRPPGSRSKPTEE